MKALTVWQPWASLLVLGIKGNETRAWRTNYSGDILIHAAKRPVSDGLDLMNPEAADFVREIFQDKLEALPTGAIVGRCRMLGCVEITKDIRSELMAGNPKEFMLGDYSVGRYSWIMDDATPLEEPVPISGKQGLWQCIWNYKGELGEMRKRHEKYKEIIILEHLLEESGVRFEMKPLLDGYHIGVPTIDGFGPDRMKYSIIEHFGSYGSIFDLLEIAGPGGKLQGFLKADDVMRIVADEEDP